MGPGGYVPPRPPAMPRAAKADALTRSLRSQRSFSCPFPLALPVTRPEEGPHARSAELAECLFGLRVARSSRSTAARHTAGSIFAAPSFDATGWTSTNRRSGDDDAHRAGGGDGDGDAGVPWRDGRGLVRRAGGRADAHPVHRQQPDVLPRAAVHGARAGRFRGRGAAGGGRRHAAGLQPGGPLERWARGAGHPRRLLGPCRPAAGPVVSSGKPGAAAELRRALRGGDPRAGRTAGALFRLARVVSPGRLSARHRVVRAGGRRGGRDAASRGDGVAAGVGAGCVHRLLPGRPASHARRELPGRAGDGGAHLRTRAGGVPVGGFGAGAGVGERDGDTHRSRHHGNAARGGAGGAGAVSGAVQRRGCWHIGRLGCKFPGSRKPVRTMAPHPPAPF